MCEEAICGVCHKEFSVHQIIYDGLCQGCHELRLAADMKIAMNRGMIQALPQQPAPEQWIVNCFRSRAIRREDVAEFHISPPQKMNMGDAKYMLLARPRAGGDNLLIERFSDFAAAQEALAAIVGNKVFLGHRISKRATSPAADPEKCPACADGQWLVRETTHDGRDKRVCSCGFARYGDMLFTVGAAVPRDDKIPPIMPIPFVKKTLPNGLISVDPAGYQNTQSAAFLRDAAEADTPVDVLLPPELRDV